MSSTLLMLTLVFVLRALFLLIELPAAEYLSNRGNKSARDGVEARESARSLRSSMRSIGIAVDTESSKRSLVLLRALGGAHNGAAMLVIGVVVNVVIVVVETAWCAWDKCAADDATDDRCAGGDE